MRLNPLVKTVVVFVLSTLSCSIVAGAGGTLKHGMDEDAASRDMESLLTFMEETLPNKNKVNKQQKDSKIVQEKKMMRPTERARRRGLQVTNKNEGYTYIPIDKFAMVITTTSKKNSSMIDLQTLHETLTTSLENQFRMSSYSDMFIVFDSVTLAGVSIQKIPTPERHHRHLVSNNNEEEQYHILVEGGVALFETFVTTPSYEQIQSIVKTCLQGDDLVQNMKASNLFPDLTSIQSIDDPSSIQSSSPVKTIPPTLSPTTKTQTKTTTIDRNPNQIQASSHYDSSSSDNASFAVVISIVGISIGVLAVSIALFVKKRRYDRKEWCTDNFNHQHDLNLASMDSQLAYNTGVVSLGEQSYVDNDIYNDQQRRHYPTTTMRTPPPGDNHTAAVFRDNLLEITRNLFVNFGSDKSTDSKSRGNNHSLEPTIPSFDEDKWKNMHLHKKTKSDPSSPDGNVTVSTVDADDLESPSPSPVKRYTIDKPIPLNKRMRSTSSTSTMSENPIKDSDLEPDSEWDPNDNDADSDVASIDAQFMIT